MRVKEVYNSSEVAHRWANKLGDYARVSHGNFYFRGDTIYSYGSHFPIAVHHNDVILFTTRSYSNTTSKHIWEVRSACSHRTLIHCTYPESAASGYHDKNIESWLRKIDIIAQSLGKARKPQKYMSEIATVKDEMQKYLDYFKIKLTKPQLTKISFTNSDEYVKAQQEARKKQKQLDSTKLAAGKKIYEAQLAAWKNGMDERDFNKSLTPKQQTAMHFYLRQESADEKFATRLRTMKNNTVIETSKGIKLPVDVAKRYYNWYNHIVAKGGCKDCDYKILEYSVIKADADALVVGCHNIPSSEIKSIAEQLNW